MSSWSIRLFLVVTAVSALGCGGDDVERTANFASMTSQQLRAVIEFTTGASAATAYTTMIGAESDSEASGNACPSRSYSGSVMTVIADDCTTADGTRYDGRIVATNALTLRDLGGDSPLVDPAVEMSIRFDFRVVSEDGELSLLGRIAQSSPTAARYESHSVLTLAAPGGRIEEEVLMQCDGRDQDNFHCDLDEAVFSLDGLGTYTAEGQFGRGQGDPVGILDLRGRQPLHIELGAGPCHMFEIGDKGDDRGEICWDED
jgi:hypothetical protein